MTKKKPQIKKKVRKFLSQTAHILRETGLDVADYAKAPFGSDVFTISVRPKNNVGQIVINEGNAKIDIHPDPERRQVVLNVKEQGRRIVRRCSTYMYYLAKEPEISLQESRLIGSFPVALPKGARYKVEDLKCTVRDTQLRKKDYEISGKVIATVRGRSRMTFLTGVDEKHHFICALPERANSVEEAHKILRPRGVPEDAPRQGEWFFVPVTGQIAKELDAKVARNASNVRARSLELWSSHIAQTVLTHEKSRYAIGYIWDKRQTRHDPLFLPSWHRVVRNREVVVKDPVQRQRTSSWD